MVTRLILDEATIQRIRILLDAEIAIPSSDGLKPFEIIFKPIENMPRTLPTGEVVAAHHQVILTDDYNESAIRVCKELFSILQEPEDLSKIDSRLSHLLECSFERVDKKADIIAVACQKLKRLPSQPPPMADNDASDIYSRMGVGYLVHRAQSPSWSNLTASNFVDSNVLRIAIHHATMPRFYWYHTLNYINTIARLLKASTTLQKKDDSATNRARWFIIKAFLWTSWHRSVLLHISHALHELVREDSQHPRVPRASTSHKENLSFENIPLIRMLSCKMAVPEYMCQWAYELCRTDRSSVTQDLRVLCERYASFSEQLGPHRSRPRCLSSSDGMSLQCDGSSPYACHRFTGNRTSGRPTKSPNQTMHTQSCTLAEAPCFPMVWDEDMYRSLEGARAVSVSPEHIHSQKIPYCVASIRTMAISHVWSHGQGGRPNTGLNSCLHRRYCDIARRHGCDSYWMDTPCIPEDHDLRNEAIKYINSIFRDSQLTLICDRDIMEIDINDGNPSIEIKETILSIIPVCDWNVRAWTFLEAMRGVANQHVLCKNDQTISLSSLITDVDREGCMELASIFLTSDHLSMSSDNYTIGTKPTARYHSPEEAACLLSRRYATRPGDDMAIWSLLCGEQVYKTANEFWNDKYSILTSFLISSAPRISSTKGRSWAPSRPGLSYQDTPAGTKAYYAYDGQGSESGIFDDNGLHATWLFYQFPGSHRVLWSKIQTILRGKEEKALRLIAQESLKDFKWGALLQAINTNRGMHSRMKVAAPRMDDTKSPLMVLVGSNDCISWQWLGVHEWDQRFRMPTFERKAITIV